MRLTRQGWQWLFAVFLVTGVQIKSFAQAFPTKPIRMLVAYAPGGIKSLEDLEKIPPYDVHDIRRSIERNPPYGDFMGMSPQDGKQFPMVLQTSGGTTGLPRPMLYAPIDREVMGILGGRRLALHGVRPGDSVLVAYSLGLSNGAASPREALWHYSGAIPITTGGGSTTPSRRQIELIKAWNINVILTFPT